MFVLLFLRFKIDLLPGGPGGGGEGGEGRIEEGNCRVKQVVHLLYETAGIYLCSRDR